MDIPQSQLTQELLALAEAAEILHRARRVLFSTGAGMSADSGVPTYRDPDGMWRDFEPFTSRGIEPHRVSHVDGYQRDPHQAWAFHEHMRRIMAAATPHAGYGVMTRWLQARWAGRSFLLTTNVDGLHRRAGVPDHLLWERYGSLWQLSCLDACTDAVWPDHRAPLYAIDPETMRALDIPRCPFCNAPARPHVQLDHDQRDMGHAWGGQLYQRFLDEPVDVYVVVGTTLWFSWPDEVAERPLVISINPSAAAHAPYPDAVAITMGAEDALSGLDFMLRRLDAHEHQ